jgi:hypothetical protein
LKNVRHFILDECDKMLESLGLFLPPLFNLCAYVISYLILFFLFLNISAI